MQLQYVYVCVCVCVCVAVLAISLFFNIHNSIQQEQRTKPHTTAMRVCLPHRAMVLRRVCVWWEEGGMWATFILPCCSLHRCIHEAKAKRGVVREKLPVVLIQILEPKVSA